MHGTILKCVDIHHCSVICFIIFFLIVCDHLSVPLGGVAISAGIKVCQDMQKGSLGSSTDTHC